MKRIITIMILTLSGCTPKEPSIVKTYEVTTEEISFHKAMMASGLSSNMDDYLDAEVAMFVALK